MISDHDPFPGRNAMDAAMDGWICFVFCLEWAVCAALCLLWMMWKRDESVNVVLLASFRPCNIRSLALMRLWISKMFNININEVTPTTPTAPRATKYVYIIHPDSTWSTHTHNTNIKTAKPHAHTKPTYLYVAHRECGPPLSTRYSSKFHFAHDDRPSSHHARCAFCLSHHIVGIRVYLWFFQFGKGF